MTNTDRLVELATELRDLSERYPSNCWYREAADSIESLLLQKANDAKRIEELEGALKLRELYTWLPKHLRVDIFLSWG